MSHPPIIGVMGGGTASARAEQAAYKLGELIARQGWILLNGGRNAGIMAASAKGAADAGGITVGILPDAHATDTCPHIQIPIYTGMGGARNAINVLSSRVVVACPGGAGTLSEIALAIKHGKPVILMDFPLDIADSPLDLYRERIFHESGPQGAIERIRGILAES